MKVGVTGGAGFIGSNLVNEIRNRDVECTVFDNFENGDIENLSGTDVDLVTGDICDVKNLRNYVENCDYIFHLAALGSVPRSIIDPVRTFNTNIIGTFNVLESCRTLNTPFTFSSSSSVYGKNDNPSKTERDWTSPISPYAASKLSAEHMILSYNAAFNLNNTVFRFFNVFGPNQSALNDYAAVIPKWAIAAFQGKDLVVFGDGEQRRDFTYVGDLIDVLIKNMFMKIERNEPINLAYGNSISLNELFCLFEQYFGKLKKSHIDKRSGDIVNSKSDPTKFNEIFGTPAQTDFQVALHKTFDWIKFKYKF